ncbi:hypothetical protein Tco_0455869 [Tanacetum coccineum]
MVAYLKKTEGSEGFHQIVDFLNASHIRYALTENPTIYVSLIQQFWQTATASTLDNGEMEIIATIDGKVKIVTEASIRRHLKLEDSDGISNLPTTEIFEQLALMGNMRRASNGYSGVDIPLFPTMLVQGPNLQGQGLTVQSDSHHTTTSGPSTSPPYMQTTHVFYTIVKKVESFESDLKQTKLTYGVAFTKLIVKVKMLKKEVKLNKAKRRAKIVVSDDEDAEKDTSKQGRSLIRDIDQIQGFLVHMMLRIRGGFEDGSRVHTYSRRRRTVSTGSGEISTGEESVSTVGALMLVSTAGMDQGSIPSPSASKDKAIRLQEHLDEEESQRISRDAEVVKRLQEEIDASERQRMAQVHQAAQGFTDAEWDDILARVAADEDLVQQLQAGEKYSEEDLPMKLVELVNQRKKFFAQQIAEAKRNKLMIPSQQKAYMSTYIKNQEGGYSIKQLKSLSFEQVKEIFEATMRRVQSFVPMDSELEVQRLKRAGQEVFEETAKRQKIEEASGSGEEQSAEKEKELSEEELQKLMMIVPVEEVYVEALQKLIDFDDMLKKFDRVDLDNLWSLVKERFSSIAPTDDKERILMG